MNKTLQAEIRAFIGDDPARAVERVRERRRKAQDLVQEIVQLHWCDVEQHERALIKRYGLAAYGAGLMLVNVDEGYTIIDALQDKTDEPEILTAVAAIATADSETRIAAMLWAAAHVVEVTE